MGDAWSPSEEEGPGRPRQWLFRVLSSPLWLWERTSGARTPWVVTGAVLLHAWLQVSVAYNDLADHGLNILIAASIVLAVGVLLGMYRMRKWAFLLSTLVALRLLYPSVLDPRITPVGALLLLGMVAIVWLTLGVPSLWHWKKTRW